MMALPSGDHTALSSSSLRPLAGVRVLLHIRNGHVCDEESSSKVGEDGRSQKARGPSVREILRSARTQVEQLGATLALSEAAADLVVFHRGTPAFLQAMQDKFKTVVYPGYLAACLEEGRRVSPTPYLVQDNTTIGVETAPARRRTCASSTSSSAGSSSPSLVQKQPSLMTKSKVPFPDMAAMPGTSDVTAAASSCLTPSSSPSRHLYALCQANGSTITTTGLADGKRNAEEERNVREGKTSPPASSQTCCLPLSSQGSVVPSPCGKEGCGSGVASQERKEMTNAAVAMLCCSCCTQGSTTPQLTPSVSQSRAEHRHDADKHVGGNDTRDLEDDEAIRHRVLRSTASAAMTRRCAKAPKSLHPVLSCSETGSKDCAPLASVSTNASLKDPAVVMEQQQQLLTAVCSRDPFLHPGTGTPPQLRGPSSASVSEGRDGGTAVTQLLSSSPSHPLLVTTHTSQRGISSSPLPPQQRTRAAKVPPSIINDANRKRTGPPKLSEGALAQRKKSRKEGAVQNRGVVAAKPTHNCQRLSNLPVQLSDGGGGEEKTAVSFAEPPLRIASFTDPSLLRRLNDGEESGAASATKLCVRIFLDEAESEGLMEEETIRASTTASQLSFFCDVVEQLGATCVIGDGSEDENMQGSCFSRRTVGSQTPTHLVVDPHAILTPGILYYKAFGIPIVTPQWLYDAIYLGGFPAIVPSVHAHPLYGDLKPIDRLGLSKPCGILRPSRLADAEAMQRVELLGVGEEEEEREDAYAKEASVQPRLLAPTVSRWRRLPQRSNTLRELHKEVAEEFVPAGEQALRPYFQPIFQDRMFYLYVPPVDLARAKASRLGEGNASVRDGRAIRVAGAYDTCYLGGVTEALAQVTVLLRLLGGTVTRNIKSTYLDLVIDLTGFYQNTIEAGHAVRARYQRLQMHHQARLLRESLSCAFQDALQRVSQLPLVYDEPEDTTFHEGDAPAVRKPERFRVPPIVGIAWLVHSILTRQWTATGPFELQEEHPLSSSLRAAHEHQRSGEGMQGEARSSPVVEKHIGLDTVLKDGPTLPLVSATSRVADTALSDSATPYPEPLLPPPPRLAVAAAAAILPFMSSIGEDFDDGGSFDSVHIQYSEEDIST